MDCTINGVPVPDIIDGNMYREDGLVLCFSNTLSSAICRQLGKTFCVAVDDMASLKRLLDEQVGIESIAGHCEYTDDHQRDHFMKLEADEWMDEFRLFWRTSETKSFHLPPSIGRLCQLP